MKLVVAVLLALILIACAPTEQADTQSVEEIEWVKMTSLPSGYRVLKTKTPNGWVVIIGHQGVCYVPDAEHVWGKE